MRTGDKVSMDRLRTLKKQGKIRIVKDVAGMAVVKDVNPNPLKRQRKRFSFMRGRLQQQIQRTTQRLMGSHPAYQRIPGKPRPGFTGGPHPAYRRIPGKKPERRQETDQRMRGRNPATHSPSGRYQGGTR